MRLGWRICEVGGVPYAVVLILLLFVLLAFGVCLLWVHLLRVCVWIGFWVGDVGLRYQFGDHGHWVWHECHFHCVCLHQNHLWKVKRGCWISDGIWDWIKNWCRTGKFGCTFFFLPPFPVFACERGLNLGDLFNFYETSFNIVISILFGHDSAYFSDPVLSVQGMRIAAIFCCSFWLLILMQMLHSISKSKSWLGYKLLTSCKELGICINECVYCPLS